MPGNEHLKISEAIHAGVREELASELDIDNLAGRARDRWTENTNITEAIGERFIDPRAHERLDRPNRRFHHIDISRFGVDLLNELNGQCVGYVVRLTEQTGPGLVFQSGLARGVNDGNLGWTQYVRMHVASVSKLITAMAAVKVLDDAGIDANEPIRAYLPNYWIKGSNIEKVTFHRLLTHTSGFANPTSDVADFGELKAQVARGTYFSPPQPKPYQNNNIAMFRILIPTITGAISPTLKVTGLPEEATDRLWDAATIKAYSDYVHEHVFAPAGVADVSLASRPGYALGYRFPMTAAGWDSLDLSSMAATISWHLSALELVQVLKAFQLDGSIVSKKRAEQVLKAEWGVDRTRTTKAGRWYLKAGRWESGSNQLCQAVAGILPGGMQLAVFVNSQFRATDPTPLLVDVVGDLLDANVTPIK